MSEEDDKKEASLPDTLDERDNQNEQDYAIALIKVKQELRGGSLEDMLHNKSSDRFDTSNSTYNSTTALNKQFDDPLIQSKSKLALTSTKIIAKSSSLEKAFWKHEQDECEARNTSDEEHEKVIIRLESVPKQQKRCYKSSVDASLKNRQDNSVLLNVYGLTQFNKTFHFTGVGVYHSGVQVYGNEWAYGSFPLPISSIFMMNEPRDLRSLSHISGRFHFVKSIYIGRTRFNREEIVQIV